MLIIRLPILLMPLAGALVAADLGLDAASRSTLAAERCVFPNDPSVLDVKRDFGAKGNGVADDTAALQAGIAASSNRGREGGTRILFLPNGTYRITSNLVVKAAVGPWVYGESRDGVVIRLADGVPTNVTAVLRTHPSATKETSADFFMRNFRNLTIDVGRNPDADGIRWYGNNSGILKNVRVLGNGRVGVNSGWLGQNGPNLIQDVLVEGAFETGVRCAWSWGQTLSRVTVRNARAVGVYVNATAVGIEDLVVEDTPVALHNEYPNDWKWWGGVVALTGGRFTGSDARQPAITNTSVLYARNVTSRGFKQVLHSTTAGGHVAEAKLDEYLSHPAKKLFPDTPETALKLPIRPEPLVPWETNLSNWVCANDHGAKFGDNRDDTATIQAAIDAAAAAGKTVVFLRGIGGGDPNWYNLNGEVRVHGSVRWIIGLGFGRVIGGDKGRFIVDDRSAPVVKFMHLQAFGGRPPVVENRSATNTLVVESCDLKVLGSGGGDIFVTDCPSAVELGSPGQRLWARQLNPEGDSNVGLVLNHGGRLWALGVKHEGRGVRCLTDQGGQTEILGLFNYAPDIAKDDERPAFNVVDATFSAAGVREISFGNTYPVKARERRGEDVRSEKGGGWIGWALFRSGTNKPASAVGPAATLNPAFPLKASENRRYLVDQTGKPFFVMGDTPWFIQKLKVEEVRMLMDDRVAKGFNTLFLELLDDSRIPSRDGNGNAAFQTDTDITQPAEAYWKYAEQVMEEAEKRDLFVIHSELWYGAGKGLWMHHVKPDNAKVYGAFIGKRFARFKNLMWMHAGDRNPDANLAECTRILAREIQAAAPHHLHTVHNAHEFASARFHHEDAWLDVNLGYTYGAAYLHILPEYQRTNPVRPVILGETGYEAEPNAIHLLPDAKAGDLWTPFRIRRNAWWAVTSGAMGYCAGTRLWRWEPNWRETMQVRSTREAPNLLRGLSTSSWWKLAPDAKHEFLTAGFAEWKQADYATAALADDGSCAIVYLPTPRTITVDLAKLQGPVRVRWFDPTTGKSTVVEGEPFSQGGKREFTPRRANAAGESDWVLFCQTESPDGASLPVNRLLDSRHAADTSGATASVPGTETTFPGLPRLRVSENHRFLVTAEGNPFFWLADTAWELFHRLDRDEAELYLKDRAEKGFTVIQAVALSELDGLTEPNRLGHLPLLDKNPARPDVKPGPANDYWDFVDEVLDLAAANELQVGFLPTWGRYVTSSPFDGKVDGIFNTNNAFAYGRFLGERFRHRANLIWILGGDKAPSTPAAVAIWRAMAQGITLGVTGTEDHRGVLMTYHTSGPGHVSDYIHDEPWLDFTSAQSSHGDLVESWRFIEKHWDRQPIKPVIDLESTYPNALIPAAWLPEPMRATHRSTKPATDDHARRAAYWAVFAGAFGHTYGHNAIWQMYAPPHKPVLDPKLTWREALAAPSATQMGHLRRLMESRPFLTQAPDQSLIAGDARSGPEHMRALRGEGYALVYTPTGNPFRVRLDKLEGLEVQAWWFDPRTGGFQEAGRFAREGEREFTPPGQPSAGNDWVLALDDPARQLPAPGSARFEP